VPDKIDAEEKSGIRIIIKIGIGWTNFAAVAMERKKEGFKKFLDSFHQT
jgi:hypothetical protein